MATAIKSVVVDIETQLNDKGINELTKGLSQSDKLAQSLKRQLEAVNTTLAANAKNRDITLKGAKTNIKELTDLRNALLATAKEYGNLSKEQRETLTELLNTNAEVIQSLEQGNSKVLEAKGGMEGYFKAINIVTPALGRHGVAISLVVTNYLEYIRSQRDGTQGATQFGSVLGLLKNKWVLLGTAVSTVIGLAANEYFRNTQEGADKLDETIGGLKETGRGVIAVLVTLGRQLTTLPFTQKAKELGELQAQLLKGLFSNKFFDEGVENAKAIDAIGDATSRLELEQSRLNLQLLQAREAVSDEAKSLDDIITKRNALAEILRDEPIIAANNEKLAKARFDAELQRVAFLQRAQGVTAEQLRAEVEAGNVVSATDAQRTDLINARKEVDNARGESLRTNIRLNKLEKSVNVEEKALLKDYQDITEGFIETSKQLELADPFNLSKLVKEEDKILAQDRLNKAFQEISDQIKRQSELLGVENILTLTPAQIANLERKYNLVGGTIFNSILRGLESQGSIVDAIFEIGGRSTDSTTPLLPPKIKKDIIDITKQISEAVNNTKLENQPEQEKATLFERFFAVTPEQKEEVKAAFQEAKAQIIDAANAYVDAEIRKTDFLISEQERRIEEVNSLAALGNAEQLQLEQERLNNLLNERRKFEEQQAAINAASVLSATAASAAYFVGAIAKESFTKDPLLAIVNSIALLATIAAGVAQISALSQGFAEGTESVQPKGSGQRAPSDTVPAWLTPGERIVPLEINKALQGISNENLPKYVALGKMMEQGYSTSINFGNNSEAVALLKEQNTLLKENTRAIATQIVDIQFDNGGFMISQRRAKRLEEKRKALVR